MKKSFNQSVEQGFTIGSIILVIALLACVFFAYRFVAGWNAENKKQAGILQAKMNGEEEPVPEDERYDGSGQPDPESSVHELPIKRVNIELQAIHTILKATLPVKVTGTCSANLELPDGSDKIRFVEEIEAESICQITIPNEKLSASKTWRFRMSYVSQDGSLEGTHDTDTFVLN